MAVPTIPRCPGQQVRIELQLHVLRCIRYLERRRHGPRRSEPSQSWTLVSGAQARLPRCDAPVIHYRDGFMLPLLDALALSQYNRKSVARLSPTPDFFTAS